MLFRGYTLRPAGLPVAVRKVDLPQDFGLEGDYSLVPRGAPMKPELPQRELPPPQIEVEAVSDSGLVQIQAVSEPEPARLVERRKRKRAKRRGSLGLIFAFLFLAASVGGIYWFVEYRTKETTKFLKTSFRERSSRRPVKPTRIRRAMRPIKSEFCEQQRRKLRLFSRVYPKSVMIRFRDGDTKRYHWVKSQKAKLRRVLDAKCGGP